jgi:hypothetical protein
MMGPGYQPEQQRDQHPIGPGGLRPATLAELALQHGELMLEQQNFRSTPGSIPTRDPSRREDPGGGEEDETQIYASRSSPIGHGSCKPMTSMDGRRGTFRLPQS